MGAAPTKAAITRVIDAVKAAGLEIGDVVIGGDGSITIKTPEPKAKAKPKGPVAWD